MDRSTQRSSNQQPATACPPSTSKSVQQKQQTSENEEDSDDYTSSSGSSSEYESSDEEQAIQPSQEPSSSKDASFPLLLTSSTGQTATIPRSALASRIAEFLPSLAAANERLQQEQAQEGGASSTLEVGDDEDEPHVDMNVALGVLEEVPDSDSDDSSEESSEVEDLEETDKQSEAGEKRRAGALEEMMGRKKKSQSKPAIEEVAEEKPSK